MSNLECSYRGLNIKKQGGELLAVSPNSTVEVEQYKNKRTSYNETSFSLKINGNNNGTNQMFKTRLEENEVLLESLRINSNININEVISGLLGLLTLVEDGKVFDTALHPLNFVYDLDALSSDVRVKYFVRKNISLDRITGEWFLEVKKLIAYFLTSPDVVSVEEYERCTIDLLVSMLDEDTKVNYFTLTDNQTTVKDMYILMVGEDELDIEDNDAIATILHYPKYNNSFKTPVNELSSDASSYNSGSIVSDDYDDEGYYSEGNNNYDDYDTFDFDEDNSYDTYDDSVEDEGKKGKKNKKREKAPKQSRQPRERNGGVGLLTVLIIGLIFLGGGVALDRFVLNKPAEPKVSDDANMYQGLLDVAMQNYSGAVDKFDKFNAENKLKLSGDEKNVIFLTYVLSGDYNKAMKFDGSDENAEMLINYLRGKDEDGSDKTLEKELNNITSNASPFEIERAIAGKDYEKIVSLKDKVKTEDIKKRQGAIAEALVKTGDTSGAISFAKSVKNNDLYTGIKSWGYEEIDKTGDSKEVKTEKKLALDKEIEKAKGGA